MGGTNGGMREAHVIRELAGVFCVPLRSRSASCISGVIALSKPEIAKLKAKPLIADRDSERFPLFISSIVNRQQRDCNLRDLTI